jgi:hypothetical protein
MTFMFPPKAHAFDVCFFTRCSADASGQLHCVTMKVQCPILA